MLANTRRCLSLSHLSRVCHQQLRRNYAQQTSDEWKSVIGLEVHVQLSVESKLFSSGSSEYGLRTNSGVNLFDAAIPGTLPVLNKKAVELAVATSLALKCKVNPVSMFERKHYFYPDLPNGYQITQQRMPLAQNGHFEFMVYNKALEKGPYNKTSKIKQIQLEQDSGKTLHISQSQGSFIDLNRSGIALIELVFEPDLSDAEEAAALVKDLCVVLERVGSCSCKMEEGAMRVDANVSVHKEGTEWGVRTEIKNIGSVRCVAKAIKYEISRQINTLESGGTITNQTLTWDTDKTVLLREKESFYDYRFMPEPNLPPLRVIIDDTDPCHLPENCAEDVLDLRGLKTKIPRLPQDERTLLIDKYNLPPDMAYEIVDKPELQKFFLDIMNENSDRNPKTVHKVLIHILLTWISKCKMEPSKWPVSSSQLGEIVDLVETPTITQSAALKVLEEIFNGNPISPKQFVEEKDLYIMSEGKLRELCQEVIRDNPKAFKDYAAGKKRVENFFVRQVLAKGMFRVGIKYTPEIMKEELEAEKRKKTGS